MSWEKHEVSVVDAYVILCDNGRPLYVAEGPFVGITCMDKAEECCKALNLELEGSYKYHVATHTRCIELEVQADNDES